MLVRYWQPWREIETLRHQFDQMFDDLTHVGTDRGWTPAVELKDEGDHIILRAELPGIDTKDLDVQVMREAVSLAGEYRTEEKTEKNGFYRSEFRYGKFQRVIPLPVAIENTQVTADYKDGILHLTLPKAAEVRNQVVKLNLTGETAPEAIEASSDAVPSAENS